MAKGGVPSNTWHVAFDGTAEQGISLVVGQFNPLKDVHPESRGPRSLEVFLDIRPWWAYALFFMWWWPPLLAARTRKSRSDLIVHGKDLTGDQSVLTFLGMGNPRMSKAIHELLENERFGEAQLGEARQ